MKLRILVLTPIMVLLVMVVQAQGKLVNKEVPIFQAGLKVGANIFKVDGKSFKDEFKFGYHAGGFIQLKLSDKWQLQPEVMWNQFNTKTDTSLGNIYKLSNLKDVKLNYLSVPVLLTYNPTKLISLQAGPQFGILIDKNKGLFDNGKEAFKSGDLSMLGGVQLNLGNIRVSGRYVVGLSNINDIDNKEKWKNQGFQVSIGMRII
jgi:hypothetical protein